MEKYGTEARLLENQLYEATISIFGQEKTIRFTSKYNPLFSSSRMIRSDFRTLFADYTDDEINQALHDNSKLAVELSEVAIDIDSDEIPYAAKQYVRYKTQLGLAKDLFLTMAASSGQQDKQIGDMRIVKQVQSINLKPILETLEKQVAVWESQLAGMQGGPASAVRAGATAYPLEGRVNF